MKRYTLKAVRSNFDWRDIPALNVDEILWTEDAGIKMTQQLCYDYANIYIHQTAVEQCIRCEEMSALGQVCNDSCMEFFFDFGCDGRYFNFEINPAGNIYLGFGAERKTRMRLISKDPKGQFMIRTNYTDDGWECFYNLSLGFINKFYPDFKLERGTVFRANCYKCGDKTEVPHYMTWNRVETNTPDYHRPEFFGEMLLG